MGIRGLMRSGAFAATVFALVVVLVPFAVERIGETTGFFRFPATAWLKGLFSSGSGAILRERSAVPVDWERYRQDLEEFTRWAESQSGTKITLAPREVTVISVEDEKSPEQRIWPVHVVSCTAASSASRGYAFISGFDRPFEEGSLIAPSEEFCGYEIVSVGERSVWFRVVLSGDEDVPMGVVRLPEFTRVDGESLVKGNRRFVARDAFQLTSGGWLMIDSFMSSDGVLFKLLDRDRRVVASILCVVIGERGGG